MLEKDSRNLFVLLLSVLTTTSLCDKQLETVKRTDKSLERHGETY